MIHDIVYLFLVIIVIYITYYRVNRNIAEGFDSKEGRIVTIYIILSY